MQALGVLLWASLWHPGASSAAPAPALPEATSDSISGQLQAPARVNGTQRPVAADSEQEQRGLLSRTLGTHMVLQRAPHAAVVWGYAAAGIAVTVSLG